MCKGTDNFLFAMPLYKTITAGGDCRAYIWKVVESEEDLARNVVLTPRCQERVRGMRSGIHRRGFLSIRHLMAEAGYTDADLFYDVQGKPHLRDGTNISITHSFEFTGLILSSGPQVGIDIEMQRDKILRIAQKFTPLREYRSLANEDALIRKLTMVWAAKESLYKIMGLPGLSFLSHIHIEDFDLDSGESSGRVSYKGERAEFKTHFLEFEGYTCAYALKL